MVARCGRNGACNSALFDSRSGLVPAASGSIVFAGEQLVGRPAPDIARAGVGYVPQGRGIFAGMTVAENLALGRLDRSTSSDGGLVWREEHILEMLPVLQKS